MEITRNTYAKPIAKSNCLSAILALLLVAQWMFGLEQPVAQTAAAEQPTLVARCIGSNFLRVQAYNPTGDSVTLTRDEILIPDPTRVQIVLPADAPAELLGLFPIESIPEGTKNSPAYTWDIPKPGIWFEELFTESDGLDVLDGWTLAGGTHFGAPPSPTNVYDELKPCDETVGIAVPAAPIINRITVLECKHATVPSLTITAKAAWTSGYPRDDQGCDLARGSTYGVVDINDSGNFNWGIWTAGEDGHLNETVMSHRDYIPVMKEERELEFTLAEGGPANWEETSYVAEPLIDGECESDGQEVPFYVCYRIAYLYPDDWEPAARLAFMTSGNPIAGGQNGIFQNYDVGLRGFVVYCDSVPVDLPYFNYYGFWGELIKVNPGHFFPRALAPGNCVRGSHNGYTVSSITETKSPDSVVPAGCGSPCDTLVGDQKDASSLVETQFYTKLNDIPGRKWIERSWIGTGNPCDPIYNGHCYKVYISVPNSYVAPLAEHGLELASVGGPDGQNLVPVNQAAPGCTVSRPGSYDRVYSGITCTGFTYSEQVTFHWDSASGDPVTSSTITATWNGRAVAIFRPILDSVNLSAGTHKIVAVGATSGTTLEVSYPIQLGATTPVTVVLDKEESKYNGAVVAELHGFAPGSTVTLRWPGGTVLGVPTTVDAYGNATISFLTPLVQYGTYTLTGTDTVGTSATDTLKVIPRALLNETQGPVTINPLRIYCYGFTQGDSIEARFYNLAETSYTMLGTMSIDSDGRGTRLITLPANAQLGTHKIYCKRVSPSTSGSTTFTVTAPNFALEPTPKPTKTPKSTRTPTPTGTPTSTPTATSTAPPTSIPTEVVPTETATELATATPSETPTVVATDVPDGSPVVVLEETPTLEPAPPPTAVVLLNEPFVEEFDTAGSDGVPVGWSLGTSSGSTIQVLTANGEAQFSGSGAALMIRNDYQFDAPSITGTFRFDAAGGTAGIVFGYQDSSNFYAVLADEANDMLVVWRVANGVSETVFAAPVGSVPIQPGVSFDLSVVVSDSGELSFTLSSDSAGELSWPNAVSSAPAAGRVAILVLSGDSLAVQRLEAGP